LILCLIILNIYLLHLQLSVIGTPAEEGKGGKIVLLKQHVFDGIDVAMMAHPTPSDDVSPIIIARERFVDKVQIIMIKG